MHEWGILKQSETIIKGYFNNDNLDGYGEIFNKENNITIEGYWKEGILNVQNKQYYDTYLYQGNLDNGNKNGIGTQIWIDKNEKYEGDWKDGNYEGYDSIYYYSNGNKYIGEWKNNLKNGFGELIWSNGKKYIGYFENDNKEDIGIFYYQKDCINISFWKNGKKTWNRKIYYK